MPMKNSTEIVWPMIADNLRRSVVTLATCEHPRPVDDWCPGCGAQRRAHDSARGDAGSWCVPGFVRRVRDAVNELGMGAP